MQANFAARVQKNLYRLLHRRSIKKTEPSTKSNDSTNESKPSVQHKLIERLKVEEGLVPLRPTNLGQTSLSVRRPSLTHKDISLSAPVRRGSLFAFPKFKPDTDLLARRMTKLTLSGMQPALQQRRSSTSTAFVKDTISNPNRSELILCISYALYYHMSIGMQTKVKLHEDIFSEKIHPMTKEKPNFSKMPPLDTVYNFILALHEHSKSDHEVIIMCLAYVERLLEISKVTFDATNWRRITLAAFIVADKVWNDLAVWNEDFLALFKGFVKIRDLNALEMRFLTLIQYKIFLKSSMYTKYYFELKACTRMNLDKKMIGISPTKADASRDASSKALQRQQRRSMSLDGASTRPLKRSAIVLN